jgi:hypothetical protein
MTSAISATTKAVIAVVMINLTVGSRGTRWPNEAEPRCVARSLVAQPEDILPRTRTTAFVEYVLRPLLNLFIVKWDSNPANSR